MKTMFSNVMLSCFLYFLFTLFHCNTFLTIIFEKQNNIDSKTKTLLHFMKSFEILKKNKKFISTGKCGGGGSK